MLVHKMPYRKAMHQSYDLSNENVLLMLILWEMVSVETTCFFQGLRLLTFYPSILGNKKPHFGELIFQEVAYKLKLRSKAEEGEINEYEKTKKTVDLKGN